MLIGDRHWDGTVHAGTSSYGNRDPYDVLGVSREATPQEIKRAYRKKALTLHPDVNKAPDAKERFMEAKNAYQEILELKQGQRGRFTGGASPGGFNRNGRESSRTYGQQDSWSYKRDKEEEDFYGLGRMNG